jgi:hypothetical protein
MPNYQNSKIYSIRSYQTDDVYYGSTTQPLSKRMTDHRASYIYWLKGKTTHITSFEILKYEDAYIELVESHPCKNKEELNVIEASYIRNRPCVNKQIPGRSQKQWCIDNKEKLAKYYAQYRIDNKKNIAKYYAQYRIDNKKKLAKQKAQYRIDNKEKIRAQRGVKTDCPCGGRYIHNNKSTHLKTKKHQKYIASTF